MHADSDVAQKKNKVSGIPPERVNISINQSFITPEGSKIKTHIQYTVKFTKKQYTHLKKHLKHLYKYHVKTECNVDSKVCQTAVLIVLYHMH